MSIRIIFGKPGSCKSMYAVQEVLMPELLGTQRPIVTNLPLRIGRLNEFLQQRHPTLNIACHHRITKLEDSQLSEFYKVRPEGSENGVCYIIDEAQIPFNARDWAQAPRATFAYLTQHRHQGDDVWAVTQAPGNLDKQFRSLAQDFRRMRNDRLVTLGAFRGLNQFRCQHFDTEPSGKGEPYKTEKFTFDFEGVGSCYDTSGGIGLAGGNKADIGARAKGITIGWGVAGLFALASLVFVVPWGMGKATESYLGKGKTAEKEPEKAHSSPGTRVPETSTNSGVTLEAAPVVVRGYLVRGNRVQVVLSDGRTLTESTNELSQIDRAFVVVDGKRVYLKTPERSEVMTPQVAAVVDAVQVAPVIVNDSASTWQTGPDGVQRLRNTDTLAKMFSR